MKGPFSGNEVIDERYRQIHQENWQTGTTFGRTLSKSFVSWKPFVWNTVCVVMSSGLGYFRTYLNGKIVQEDKYSGRYLVVSLVVRILNCLKRPEEHTHKIYFISTS